jgi:hypothetical protein
MEELLLDCIILNDGKELFGIIDYITAKHIYFFDFSHHERSNYLLIAAVWRGASQKRDEIRFSVYSMLEFPQIPLPQATLIPKANVMSCNMPLYPTKKTKQKKIKIQ